MDQSDASKVAEQATDNRPSRPSKAFGRDRITNGTALFFDGDLRSKAARRVKGIIQALTTDLGGPERMGEARRQLIRRVAMLGASCEQMEADSLVSGKPIDMDLYGRMSGHQRRLLETLGLDRVPRDVAPDLETYLEGLHAAEASAAERSCEPEEFA